MFLVPSILLAALLFVPMLLGWYLSFKLQNYHRPLPPILGLKAYPRPRPPSLSIFRLLRPDQYTDEGQDLLRRLWLLVVLTIPWWLLVFFLLRER